jgi:hypothetical protein
MAELRLPVGAEQLLRYFEGVDREYPGQHWRNGAEMCRRWQALLTGHPTQADIEDFVTRLEAEPNYGSGWLDLGMQFRHWARSRGFRA